MIILTKLGGGRLMINEELIETVVQTPDTIVNMSTGHSFIVSESLDEIMQCVIDFRRSCRRRTRPHRAENNEE